MPLSQPGNELELPKSSREWVRHVSLAALQKGEPPPTQQAIRSAIEKHTGARVSPNLVADELLRLWAEIGPALLDRVTLPGVSDAGLAAFQQLWLLAVREGRNHSTQELADVQAALATTTSLLEQRTAELVSVSASQQETQSALATAMSQLANAEPLAQTVQELSDALAAEKAARSHDRQEWEAIVAERRRELERVEAQRDRDASQWADLRAYLMQETDRIRTELRGRIESLEQTLATEKSALEAQRLTYFTLQQDYARLQGRLEGVTRD